MNNMEKTEKVACRKLIQSGKTSIKYRGTQYEVIDGSPDFYVIRAHHPFLESGVVRTIKCFFKRNLA